MKELDTVREAGALDTSQSELSLQLSHLPCFGENRVKKFSSKKNVNRQLTQRSFLNDADNFVHLWFIPIYIKYSANLYIQDLPAAVRQVKIL